MIIKPATILNSYEFCKRTWPKKVEAAPKIIKTIEKPQHFTLEEYKQFTSKEQMRHSSEQH